MQLSPLITIYYHKATVDTVNEYNSLTTIVQEDVFENNNSSCNYPATIPLVFSKDKLKCHKL